MKLIFIYGLPATGKLTVAQHLAAMTGFKVFHNHLVVDLLLSVFDFGSPEFVHLREEIWLSVFEQASPQRAAVGMIFTFAPPSVPPSSVNCKPVLPQPAAKSNSLSSPVPFRN